MAQSFPSRVFNWLVSRLTGVKLHDHNCGFKAYRREIFEEVRLYGERHRFVPVLAAAHGWRVGEIEVEHHAREHGNSKYGVSRILKGFLDLMTIYLLTSFSSRPLHLIGGFGMLFFALGGAGMTYLSLMWCVTRLVDHWEALHLHRNCNLLLLHAHSSPRGSIFTCRITRRALCLSDAVSRARLQRL